MKILRDITSLSPIPNSTKYVKITLNRENHGKSNAYFIQHISEF